MDGAITKSIFNGLFVFLILMMFGAIAFIMSTGSILLNAALCLYYTYEAYTEGKMIDIYFARILFIWILILGVKTAFV